MRVSWLAYPVFSGFVAAVWLLLVQSLAPGSLLLAALLGLFASFTLARLQTPGMRIRNLPALLRLLGRVAIEIARSNVAVATVILSPRRRRKSGFLSVPLELTDPTALAFLSCVLTAMPGSLWVEFDSVRGRLLLHVLDLIDEAEWVAIVRGYERRLLEIFR